MTSAVLNNLEINTTDFSTKEKNQDDMMSNQFSQILESKTTQNGSTKTDDTTITNNTIQNTISDNSKTNTFREISTDINNKNIIQELSERETEQTASNIISEITTVINDVLQEVTSELPIDFSIAQENDIVSDILINADENTNITNENSTTEQSTTEQDENSQNTITNEDSTMNKEQILAPAPENLLTFGLLQTNNQSLKSTVTNNDDENVIQLRFSERNTDYQNDNSSNFKEFKLFDNQKDMQIMENTLEDDEVITKTEGTKLRNIIDDAVTEELNIEIVESEGNPAQQNSSDLMQKQTPQEQGMKAVLQGEIKFDDSNLNISTQIKNTSPTANAGKIIEQITKQMEGMYNGSKVNIVLNPEALGRVSLQLVNGKEGLIAQFSVTSQDVRDILMKGLAGLKESLLAHGVNVDNVSVKLSESTDSEYQGDWTEREGSQGGFKGQNNKHQKEDKKQFEKMMFEIENDGNV